MKKMICVLLCLFLLCTATACTQTTQDTPPPTSADTDTPQAPHTHTYTPATCQSPQTCSGCGESIGEVTEHDVEKGKCSMCALDYYEELQALIEAKGVANQAGTLVCEYTYQSYTIWINYEPQNDNLYFMCFGDSVFDGLTLYLDKASVKSQEYSWKLSAGTFTSSSGKISGHLNATSFSKNTQALEYNNNTFSSAATASKQAQNAATMLEIVIKNGFKPLLEECDKNISVVHFGFEHFE